MTVTLKGMTWSHPRGYDPMVASANAWAEKTGVAIEWDKRSLPGFRDPSRSRNWPASTT